MTDYQSVFSDIYSSKKWKMFPWTPLSGTGSTVENTKLYRELLTNFLKEHEIKSVVDFGCGDWTFSKLIDWSDIDYLGIDVTPSVIELHQQNHQTDNIKFTCLDLTKRDSALPTADCWIIKDVFQHWPSSDVFNFLEKMFKAKCFKFIFLTNSYAPGPNKDIEIGGFRTLDHEHYPLATFDPQPLSINGGKAICVITPSNRFDYAKNRQRA